MFISSSTLTLIAVLTLALFLCITNFFIWYEQRQDKTPLWLAAWLAASIVFVICRLVQFAPVDDQMYRVVPRILITSSVFIGWLGYELANSFIEYRPSQGERAMVISGAAVLIAILWASNWILTNQIIVRTSLGGGEFHGVMVGPLYLPATLLILTVVAIPLIRLIRSPDAHKWEDILLGTGYLFAILFSLNDFLSTAFNINWVRLSDYSYLPVAILFSYIQVQRFGRLYRKMDVVVRERTAELSQANESLRLEIIECEKIEAARRASEERYSKLIDNARDLIFTLATDGTITSLNPSFELVTGWPRPDWIGHPFEALIVGEDRQRVKNQLKGILDGETIGALRLHLLTRTGKVLVVDMNISLQIKNNQVIGLLGIARDMTEEQLVEDSLKASEQQFRALIENSADAVSLLSAEGYILYASPSTRRVLGYSMEELVGRRIFDLVHPDDAADFAAHFAQLLQVPRALISLQMRHQLKTGEWHWYEGTSQNLLDEPGVQAVVVNYHDITERKRAEEKITQHAAEMTALYETTHDLVIERDLSKLLYTIVERATALMKASGGGLYLCDAEQREVRCVVSYKTPHDYTGVVLKYGEGSAGVVAETGEPLLVDDYRTWQSRATVYEHDQPFISLLSVPMRWQEQVIGVIHVFDNTKPYAFTVEDTRFVTLFANQAAVAIANSRLFESEQDRRQEAAAIAEVGRDISSSLRLDVVLERIASHAKNLLHAETSAVYLSDLSGPILRAITAIGPDAEAIKQDPLNIGEGILGNIAMQKVGEIINDTLTDPRVISVKGTELNPLEHLMGVPVLSKDHLTGLIAVWRTGKEHTFNSTDLDFLNSLAGQVGVAIENARLYEEIQKRLREMEGVAQVSAAISHTLELEPLLENVLQATIHAIPAAERGSILLADDEQNLCIRAVWGYTDARTRTCVFPLDSGYASMAFSERRAIVVPDVCANPRIDYHGDIPEMRLGGSAIAAPLIVKDRAIGVIAIDTPACANVFHEDALHFLETVASTAALAIDNAHLFEYTQRRLSELEILQTIASALRIAQTLDQALPIILDLLLKLLHVGGASLELLYPSNGDIVTELARGLWAPVTGMHTAANVGVSGYVISTGQSYTTTDVVGDGLIVRSDLVGGLNSVACVPVSAQHQPIGALWVGRQSLAPFTREEVNLLVALGEMVGNTIQRMKLFEQTERQTEEIMSAYDLTLEGWAKALELRDKETEGHSRRVADLTFQMASKLDIPEAELIHMRRGVLLHDIGKLGIPDQVLKKKGRLSEADWIELKKHPQYAYDLIYPITYLRPALDIPYNHHEHWDGSGYPRG